MKTKQTLLVITITILTGLLCFNYMCTGSADAASILAYAPPPPATNTPTPIPTPTPTPTPVCQRPGTPVGGGVKTLLISDITGRAGWLGELEDVVVESSDQNNGYTLTARYQDDNDECVYILQKEQVKVRSKTEWYMKIERNGSAVAHDFTAKIALTSNARLDANAPFHPWKKAIAFEPTGSISISIPLFESVSVSFLIYTGDSLKINTSNSTSFANYFANPNMTHQPRSPHTADTQAYSAIASYCFAEDTWPYWSTAYTSFDLDNLWNTVQAAGIFQTAPWTWTVVE